MFMVKFSKKSNCALLSNFILLSKVSIFPLWLPLVSWAYEK